MLSTQEVYDSFAFLVSLVMLPKWNSRCQDSCRICKISSKMTHTTKNVLLGVGHVASCVTCFIVSHSIKEVTFPKFPKKQVGLLYCKQ